MRSARPDSAPGAERSSPHLLVVEDHAATRAAVAALLSLALPACVVEVADSAEAALRQCEASAPDLVVMDIVLPGMNGIDAARHLIQRHTDLLVVMHTNSDSAIFIEASAAAGAHAFVSKGRTASDLVPAIQSLLATRGKPPTRLQEFPTH
jgi:DNA-binding NarL/FixJ family response regulator